MSAQIRSTPNNIYGLRKGCAVAAAANWKGKSARWVIAVRCLSCQHRGVIAETDLAGFGVKPGAPVAQFIRRLRCRQCGSGAVIAQRTTAKSVA